MKNSGELTVLEEPANEAAECIKSQSSQNASESRLQDLIPIAMVIVGGCEPCAESMVTAHRDRAARGKISIKHCASSQVHKLSIALRRPLDQK
jgi:hypothetical protein